MIYSTCYIKSKLSSIKSDLKHLVITTLLNYNLVEFKIHHL